MNQNYPPTWDSFTQKNSTELINFLNLSPSSKFSFECLNDELLVAVEGIGSMMSPSAFEGCSQVPAKFRSPTDDYKPCTE